MGIRETAQADMQNIFSDPEGAGTPFILVNPKTNKEFPVCGVFGDINLIIDPQSGAAIKGRTISAAYPGGLLKKQTDELPAKGWKVLVKDLNEKEKILFVVEAPDHDNTLGVTRLTLGANLSDKSTVKE